MGQAQSSTPPAASAPAPLLLPLPLSQSPSPRDDALSLSDTSIVAGSNTRLPATPDASDEEDVHNNHHYDDHDDDHHEDDDDHDDDHDHDDDDDERRALTPVEFEWHGGGTSVQLRGSWDAYTHATSLDHNGEHHVTLLYIPPGQHSFCYAVDGMTRHDASRPYSTDVHGVIRNMLLVQPMRREFGVVRGAPRSPCASYADARHVARFAGDPPHLPAHLEARALKPLPEDISPSVAAALTVAPGSPRDARMGGGDGPHTPLSGCPAAPDVNPADVAHAAYRPLFSHVFIDHLYAARCAESDDVLSLSQTFRFGSKVINTVFVTNRRDSCTAMQSCDIDLPP